MSGPPANDLLPLRSDTTPCLPTCLSAAGHISVLHVEAWSSVIHAIVGAVAHLGNVPSSGSALSLWRTCTHAMFASKGIKQVIHTCLLRLAVSLHWQILASAWKLRHSIRAEIMIEQLSTAVWNVTTRKCAVRGCRWRTGAKACAGPSNWK